MTKLDKLSNIRRMESYIFAQASPGINVMHWSSVFIITELLSQKASSHGNLWGPILTLRATKIATKIAFLEMRRVKL